MTRWILQRKFVEEIRTISVLYPHIRTISVRYPNDIRSVHPPYVRAVSVRYLYGVCTGSSVHLAYGMCGSLTSRHLTPAYVRILAGKGHTLSVGAPLPLELFPYTQRLTRSKSQHWSICTTPAAAMTDCRDLYLGSPTIEMTTVRPAVRGWVLR